MKKTIKTNQCKFSSIKYCLKETGISSFEEEILVEGI